MTLLYADGFEDGANGLALGTTAAIAAGRFGNGLSMTSSGGTADLGIPSTTNQHIVGVAFKPPAVTVNIFGFLFPTIPVLYLIRNIDGSITVNKYSSGILATTAPGVCPSNAWSYVEMKTTYHATAGIVVLRVNGVEVMNLSGVNTTNTFGSWTILRLGYNGDTSASPQLFDDLYYCNNLGTVNNDFLGELTVEHLRPGADDTAQWLGSDGNSINNWQLVDEPGVFASSDYVGAAAVGQRELYVPVASAQPTTSPVLGVYLNAVMQKTNVGTRTVKLDVKEGAGGIVRSSAEKGLPTSFGELQAAFERKADGTQFTVADVNALRFGVEVSA